MNIGVGRTPRSRISRCLLSQKWRHRKGSENRSPLRNHALGRSHRGLRMRCARQHWAFEPTIVLHEKRSRQGGRKRSQESGALANSSCEDHFNLSPQIYSCFTFQPPVPIESTSVQPGALQTRALCARHSLLVLISCRVHLVIRPHRVLHNTFPTRSKPAPTTQLRCTPQNSTQLRRSPHSSPHSCRIVDYRNSAS